MGWDGMGWDGMGWDECNVIQVDILDDGGLGEVRVDMHT